MENKIEILLRAVSSVTVALGVVMIHANHESFGAGLMTFGLYWMSR